MAREIRDSATLSKLDKQQEGDDALPPQFTKKKGGAKKVAVKGKGKKPAFLMKKGA